MRFDWSGGGKSSKAERPLIFTGYYSFSSKVSVLDDVLKNETNLTYPLMAAGVDFNFMEAVMKKSFFVLLFAFLLFLSFCASEHYIKIVRKS